MPAPSPAEETSRGPLGATAAPRAGAAGAGARGSRRARPGRKLLAPSWWSVRAVRPGAPAVLLAVAKRVQVAEGARAPRWRHGPRHSKPWDEWSRTARRALPQRPLQCRRARPTRRPTNASSGRTSARSIVAGRLITRLAALQHRCPGGPWIRGGRESDQTASNRRSRAPVTAHSHHASDGGPVPSELDADAGRTLTACEPVAAADRLHPADAGPFRHRPAHRDPLALGLVTASCPAFRDGHPGRLQGSGRIRAWRICHPSAPLSVTLTPRGLLTS